jgi:multidrug resistance protein MdtO
MVLTATIVMVLVMTFQIPYGAYAALFAVNISRENPDATLKAVRTLIVSFAAAVAYVLVGAFVFSGEPMLRLAWVFATLFLSFYALSALANYTAASRFGYLLAITIPLFDEHISSEQKVEGLLWAAGAIALATVIAAAIEVIYGRLYHIDEVTAALVDRLRWTESALRAWSSGGVDRAAEQQLARLTVLGTSRMRRDLLRSGYAPEVTQPMGAVVSLVGRLVDLAANLSAFSQRESEEERRAFGGLADQVDSLARSLTSGSISQGPGKQAGTTGRSFGTPLLMDMERTVSDIAEVLEGSDFPGALQLPAAKKEEPRKRFFAADAFTNPNHIRFAIRGSLAAAVCYLTFNLAAWPEISTALTTCFVTALTTIGASRQKQILRFGGALTGGIVGMCAQIFVMPGLESITGLLILFIAGTIVASWIATAGPRLSYFGVQFAFAFYLINFEEFRFQTSLAVARDRVVGILLGLVAMWLIFDQLWEAPAILVMKRTFLSTLRLVAQITREPVLSGGFDLHAALEQSAAQRETINANFNKVRDAGDGVMLEFGPSRESDIEMRSRLLQWQTQLRVIFITRIALRKYRLRLPGFELPEPILHAQEAFDSGLAERIDGLANDLQGVTSPTRERTELLLPLVAEPVQEYLRTQPDAAMAARLQSLLPLCSRIDALVTSLADEIAARS